MLVPVGCRTAAAIDPMDIADAEMVARVKTALINDRDLGIRTIEVRVVRGVVNLSGGVQTQAEADRAVALVRSVPGVTDVRVDLTVGQPSGPPAEPSPRGAVRSVDSPELLDDPGLLALGVSVGWSEPRSDLLKSRASVSPLIKLGSGRGLGWTIGFDWFTAELSSAAGSPDVVTRVQVKPVMLGAGYTLASERASLSTSLVGGYAWNGLTVTEFDAGAGRAVAVANSFAWRPAVSFWYDLSRRTVLNFSVGRVMTRLRLTVVENGRPDKRRVSGDTTILQAGVVYRIF